MEPNESIAAERMRRAVSAAVNGKGSAGELQEAARVLVDELRARNEPPEQVLLTIKQFLAEAGLRPSYASEGNGQAGLYRDMIAWTIKAYYEAKTS